MAYNKVSYIQKAQQVHGNKYDYSKTNYINSQTKIIIICPLHGEFYIAPSSHLYGVGCRHCGFEKSIKASSDTQNSFIQKAISKHGNKYDYSKVIYINSLTPVIIICKDHGEFTQIPQSHLRGRGCKLCGIEKGSEIRSYTTEEFKEKIKEIQGDIYDLSKLNYVNFDTKVKLICKDHGEFYKNPRHLISSKSGCPQCCKRNIPYTTEEFIKEYHKKYNNKYNFNEFKYISAKTKSIVICNKHGKFLAHPNSLFNGFGCPICSESKGEEKIANYLKKLNIFVKREYKLLLNDFKYDFYLPDYNLFIEFHGEQHYEYIPFFHESREHFFRRFLDDKEKEELVKYHKGKMIIINYKHLEAGNIEEYLRRQLIRYRVPLTKTQ